MLAAGEVHAQEVQARPAPAPVAQPADAALPPALPAEPPQQPVDAAPALIIAAPTLSPVVAAATATAPEQATAAAPEQAAATVTAAKPPRHVRRHAKGDPLEGLNRRMFAFHQRVDHALFRPLAMFYKHVIPKPLRTALRHILSNLTEPLVFMNDMLQLKPKRAAQTFSRFVINTSVGVGGIFDVAKTADLPHHDNSLGDTLARYGVGPGPYLFVPFFGPTNLRDLLTGQAENVIYPLAIGEPFDGIDYQLSSGLVQGLDLRAESDADFKALLDGAADPYATLRSVYAQSREAEIAGIRGKKATTIDFEDPLTDPESPKAATPEGAAPIPSDQTDAPAPTDQTPTPSAPNAAPGVDPNAAPASATSAAAPAPAPADTPAPAPAPKQLELHAL